MTLAQLQAAIQAHGYETDTAPQQTIAINTAYRNICGQKRWPFMEATATLALPAAASSISTATITDLVHMDSVRANDAAGNYYDMEWVDLQEYRTRVTLDPLRTGAPEVWTYTRNAVYVYPIADRAYTLNVEYILDPPDLSADSDIPVLPATYHDAIVSGALAVLGTRERDWNQVSVHQQRFDFRTREMDRELNLRQRQTAGRVGSSYTYRPYELF
jgi:hypothetical protein